MNDEAWPTKYRPRVFEDVIGQDAAAASLTSMIQADSPRHIVISGSSGTGKTTLALIYAQAAMCQQPLPAGSPCRACGSCGAFDSGTQRNFKQVDCGRDGTLENIRYLTGDAIAAAPLYGRRHVLFFDEAHRLSFAARDALLKPLEENDDAVVMIFSMIDPKSFPLQLTSRCRTIGLAQPSLDARTAFLERILRSEGLAGSSEAMALLARQTGSFRLLAERLEQLAGAPGARIDLPAIKGLLMEQGPGVMFAYLRAAVVGDLERQLLLLKAAAKSPSEKLEELRSILLHLKLRYIGPAVPRSVEVPFDGILDVAECQEIVDGLARRAEWQDLSAEAFFDKVLDFWSHWPGEITEIEFETQVMRFHDRMQLGMAPAERPLGGATSEALVRLRKLPPVRSRMVRPPKWALPEAVSDHLTGQQAQEIFEASTFLMQRWGLTFNTCLEVRHEALGMKGQHEAVELTSALARELGQNLKSWLQQSADGSELLHRIVVHEDLADRGLVSTMVMHLPSQVFRRAEQWIYGRFLPKRAGEVADLHSAVAFEAEDSRKASGRVERHWVLVRKLWRGLNPSLHLAGKPMIERLGVPKRERRAAGRVERRRFAIGRSLSALERTREAERYRQPSCALADGNWEMMFGGWELEAFRKRVDRLDRWQKLSEGVEADLANASDSLTSQTLMSLRTGLREEAENVRKYRYLD